MPFVQLQYSDLLVQDTDVLEGTINGNNLNLITSALMLGGRGNRQKQMSFHVNPITEKKEVYQAYLDFANSPELFVVSDKPPKCPVHIMQKCGNSYFWVPVEAGPEFLTLVMKTSLLMEQKAEVSGAYEVTIVDVIEARGKQSNGSTTPDFPPDSISVENHGLKNYYLYFDKSVPYGEARMEIQLGGDGSKNKIVVQLYEDPRDETNGLAMTDHLIAQWNEKNRPLNKEHLKGMKAKIYSFVSAPPEPEAKELKKLNNQMDRVRANQKLDQ